MTTSNRTESEMKDSASTRGLTDRPPSSMEHRLLQARDRMQKASFELTALANSLCGGIPASGTTDEGDLAKRSFFDIVNEVTADVEQTADRVSAEVGRIRNTLET